MPAPVSASTPLGIYLSIPFCRAKCSYCNFASGVFGSEKMATYVDHLVAEVRAVHERAEVRSVLLPTDVDSIYFGGGTPSLLSTEQMQRILQAMQESFSLDSQAEITMECAPGQLRDHLLRSLPGMGFNRVSLGVQSFVDHEASAVGRLHTRATTLQEIDRLRRTGIENINVDLIAGLPRQTGESWLISLGEAIASNVPHLSVYMLDVDEDSRLGREMLAGGTRYGVDQVPDDRIIADMYSEAYQSFAAEGIAQYEISNFARPGFESRHNLKYWTRQPYLGFGLDAHSFLPTSCGDMIRIGSTDDLSCYLNQTGQETAVPVSATEAIEEAWFLGLRLSAGISLPLMEQEIGYAAMRAFYPVLQRCEQQGLLEQDATHVRLTRRGRLLQTMYLRNFWE